MPFLSFGSKKNKIKKLIEEERFDEVTSMAVKDKKALQALIELLDEKVPGIRGDALLLLGILARESPASLESHVENLFPKALELTKDRNSYVRENAMVLSYELAQNFKDMLSSLREGTAEVLLQELEEGDKNLKGFALLMAGELGLKGLRAHVEELVSVEDKVILPFEGKKWVSLSDIAKEALEKLS